MHQFIFHITSQQQWQQATQAGVYQGDTLATEGFIHCSTLAQVVPSANLFFPGKTALLLLAIASQRVQAEIRYEGLPDQQQFPHIYGPLNLDAVIQVLDFTPDPQGQFYLPVGLQTEPPTEKGSN